MKVPDELNCRADKSHLIHIMPKKHKPGNYKTLCGKTLTTGLHIFPLRKDWGYVRCEKCLTKYNLIKGVTND